MLYLNLKKEEKIRIINKNLRDKIVFISPKTDFLQFNREDVYYINYSDLILYKHYNKLLQELSKDHLLVLNECLRGKDSTLHNNCLRLYANQSGKVLYFNTFPVIDRSRDFLTMINVCTGTKNKYLTIDHVDEPIVYRKKIPKFDIVDLVLTESDLEEHINFKNTVIDNFDFSKKPSTIITAIQKNLSTIKKRYMIKGVDVEIPQHNIKLLDKLKKRNISFLKSNAGIDTFILENKFKILQEMEKVYESLSRNKRAREIY